MSAPGSTQTRSVASLAALYAVRMLGLFMVLPVIALSGKDYIGSDAFLLGLALGIYGLSQAILQIPFGVFSDRYGRKPLIIFGLLVFALGSIIAACSTTIEGLIVGRVVQGAGAIAGVVIAAVGDLTSEKNRSKAMAAIGASIGVVFAISIVLGPIVVSFGGLRLIFWLSALLAILGILLVIFAVPVIPSVDKANRVSTFSELCSVLKSKHLWCLNIGIFCLHAVLMSVFIVLPLLLVSVDIAVSYHAWVYLVAMLTAFTLMVPMMVIGEKYHRVKTLILIVIVCMAMALLLLSFEPQRMWVVLGASLLFFVAFNYLEATLPSLMSKSVDLASRGSGSGVFSTCQFLGAAVGGVLGGWLFSVFGAKAALLVCSGLLLVWWLVVLFMTIDKPSPSKA